MTTVTKKLIGKINLVADAAGFVCNFEIPTVTGTALPTGIDNQTLEEIYIICDTSLGDITINLPAISNLNNAWNPKIYICQVLGTGGVTVVPYPGTTEPFTAADTMNGSSYISLVAQYDTYYLHVVSDNMWMNLFCAGPIIP